MKKILKKWLPLLLTAILLVSLVFAFTACGEKDPGPGPGPDPDPDPAVTEYTVTFDANGGTLAGDAEVKVEEGEKVAKPATDPTRGGYDFTGWFTDKAGETAYDFNAAVKANMTLYAGWLARVTVTFDLNYEGAAAATTIELSSGETVDMPDEPEREGYLFAGWFTDEAGETSFDSSAAITENVTVYAKWVEESADVVRVTFDLNYEGAPAAPVTYVDIGATVDERKVADRTETISSEDGKYSYTFATTEFDAWYTDEACTDEFDFDTALNDDITLYAGWADTEYNFEAELTNLVGKVGPGYSFSVNDEQMIRVDTAIRNQNASMGYSVGFLYQLGLSVNYRIYSDRDVDNVKLVARLSSEYRDTYIAPEDEVIDGVQYRSYQFLVNGESVDYEPIALEGAQATAAPNQRPFDDWEISRTVSLKEGWNTIDLYTNNFDELSSTILAQAPMIDCIYLSADAELSWEPVWGNLDKAEIIDG